MLSVGPDGSIYKDSKELVGKLIGHSIYPPSGKDKLGWFQGNEIFSASGRKIAWVSGGRLHRHGVSGSGKPVSEVLKHVHHADDIPACAIYVLIKKAESEADDGDDEDGGGQE